jgi:peptidoglycan/LPS O-acetylase OafA/YrhL
VQAKSDLGRDNAFNLLRLAAALWVFISHEQLIVGSPCPVNGEIGVYVFFSISGFLIARSWDRRGSVFRYLQNRCLRILPALWTVVLLTTLVIGPLASRLPPGQYLAAAQTWRYLLNGIFDLQLQLPGVFVEQRYTAVNTPLWTLAHEALAYALLAALGILLSRSLRLFLLLAYLLLLGSQLRHAQQEIPADLMGYFMGGALIWFFRDSLKFHGGLAAAALAALAATYLLGFGVVLWTLCLPYAAVWLGLRRTPKLLDHFKHNDYSYGFYVWAMLCQHCVVRFAGIHAFLPHMALSFLADCMCAAASWFLIERRMLELKAAHKPPPDQRDIATLQTAEAPL